MAYQFSDQSQKVLALGQTEARQLNHDYVGTEHILLALLIKRPGALAAMGISAEAIRGEIEKLVVRGPMASSLAKLALTPRAQSVIESARLQAFTVGEKLIEPEHLLIGLMHEPDGVAHRVMQNLGLNLRQVQEQSMKYRLAQMRIVERAVRPLRVPSGRKRKMREELLAHLSVIYEEALIRLNDPDAALTEAAKRFGDPAQLSRELQGVRTFKDRQDYWFERWFGWRPPESAARMMLRVSFMFFCVIACIIVIPMLIEFGIDGDWRNPVAIRSLSAVVIFMPLTQFLLGICYYKTRDSLFGVFGSRKSLGDGILRSSLASLSVLVCGACAIGLMNDSLVVVRELSIQLIGVSILWGIVCLIAAKMHGPEEIRDTIWSTMDLSAS